MSTIILIISSNDKPEYSRYKEHWLSTIQQNTNPQLKYYFIELHPHLEQFIEIRETDHTILIQGNESIIPGILKKTLITIRHLLDFKEFDFIYRTNLSTRIIEPEFSDFIEVLKEKKIHYAGNRVDAWGKFQFVSGSGMFLSREACDYLIKHENDVFWNVDIFCTDIPNMNYITGKELGTQWHDDVCIGFLMAQICEIYEMPCIIKSPGQFQIRQIIK